MLMHEVVRVGLVDGFHLVLHAALYRRFHLGEYAPEVGQRRQVGEHQHHLHAKRLVVLRLHARLGAGVLQLAQPYGHRALIALHAAHLHKHRTAEHHLCLSDNAACQFLLLLFLVLFHNRFE